ncbi:prolyl oligopeptidase family serine peptidase [Bdellovibrio sp. ArHS]|uniref:prolyl oligopeptidase family serine peptidase n=1 Tax=Bdellovibrio sp. ArHS TaxID=1569284 RepID=UPI000B2AF684|nr:prolyl oligopeptidase family serine peptidase [Bdellovibrio sp. ArHS]
MTNESKLQAIFIPAQKTGAEKFPVIVALHGVGSNERDLAEPGLVHGIIAVGGRTLQETSASVTTALKTTTPKVLLLHGMQDNKLPLFHAQASADTLQKAGFDFSFKTYQAGHEITSDMKSDMQAWLKDNF